MGAESSRARAVVLEAYERLNRHDVEGFLELLAPDVRWFSLDPTLRPRTCRGRDGVRDYIAAVLGSLADYSAEPEEVRTSGDKVMVTVCHRGRGSDHAHEIEQRLVHLMTVCDGRIVRFRLYLTEPKALAALGAGREHADA